MSMRTGHLERRSALPLYAQVKQRLESDIAFGMKPGQALPSEPDLERQFGVSRITIRRALDELAGEGVIVRRQGRGTFVCEPKIAQELPQLISWSEQMRRLGHNPASTSTEIELIDASYEVAAPLKLVPGGRVVRIRRVRTADGEPVCIMSNYLPEGLAPGIIERGLLGDSLYATLASAGVAPASAEDRIEARVANDWEAHMLGVAVCSPLLQVTRLTFDAEGKPLYMSVVANRGDRYIYTIHHSSR